MSRFIQDNLPKFLIITTVALSSMGIGLIMPVMPDLLAEFGLTDVSRAAQIGGLLSLSFALMQFLTAPLLGSLSDRFGRRPVILISLTMAAFDYALMCIAPELWWLFVARMISGMTAATFTVANAFLADTSTPDQRAANFGLSGAAFGIGFVLGPLLGGVLGEFGPRAPFAAAAILLGLNAIMAFWCLPESLPKNKRSAKVDLRQANPFAIFLRVPKIPNFRRLISVVFLDHFTLMVFPAVWAYFTVAQFGWMSSTTGLSFALFGFCMILVQGFLIKHLINRFGEVGTALFGLSTSVLSFTIISLLSSGLMALILTPLFTLRAVISPAINGILSKGTDEQSQGALQGYVAAITSLGSLLSLPIMTQVFAFTTQAPPETSTSWHLYWPGAPFFLSAMCALAALVILLQLRRGRLR